MAEESRDYVKEIQDSFQTTLKSMPESGPFKYEDAPSSIATNPSSVLTPEVQTEQKGILGSIQKLGNKGYDYTIKPLRTLTDPVADITVKYAAQMGAAGVEALGVPGQLKQLETYNQLQAEADSQLSKRIAALPNDAKGNEIRRQLMKHYVARNSGIQEVFVPRELDESVAQHVSKSLLVGLSALTQAGIHALDLGTEYTFLRELGGKSTLNLLGSNELVQNAALKLAGGTVLGQIDNATFNALYSQANQAEGVTSEQIQEDIALGFVTAPIFQAVISEGAYRWFKSPIPSDKLAKQIRDELSSPAAQQATVEATPKFRREIITSGKGAARPTAKIRTYALPGTELGKDISTLGKGDYIEVPNTGDRGFVSAIHPPFSGPEISTVAEAGSRLASIDLAVGRTTSAIQQVSSQAEPRYLSTAPAEAQGLKPNLGSYFSRKSILKQLNENLANLAVERQKTETLLERFSNIFDVSKAAELGGARPEVYAQIIEEFRKLPPEVTIATRDPETGALVSKTFPFSEIKGGRVLKREYLVPVGVEEVRRTAPDVAQSMEREAAELTASQLGQSKETVFIKNPKTGFTEEVPIKNVPLANLTEITKRFGGPKSLTPFSLFDQPQAIFRKQGYDLQTFVDAVREGRLVENQTTNQIKDIARELFISEGAAREGSFLNPKALKITDRAKVEGIDKRIFQALNTDDVSKGSLKLTQNEARAVKKLREITLRYLEDIRRVKNVLGEGFFVGRENYITNLITEQASLFLKHGGAIPESLAKLTEGGEAFYNLLKTKAPSKLKDVLLENRVGGLPIKQDPWLAMETMAKIHSRYVHVAPEYYRLNQFVDKFNEAFGNMPTMRYGIERMKKYVKYMAGIENEANALKSFDRKFESLLIQQKFNLFGLAEIKNPLYKYFGEPYTLHIAGRPVTVDIPKESTTRFFEENPIGSFLASINPLTPSKFLLTAKTRQYAIDLSMSTGFITQNLTQYFQNAPTQLRGNRLGRLTDTFEGFFKAIGEFTNYRENKQKWVDAGLFEEYSNAVSEMMDYGGTQSLKNKILGKKHGVVRSFFNAAATVSEYINNVGTFHAVESSMKRDLKDGGKFFKELTGLDKEAADAFIKDFSIKAAEKTQFRFGPEVRSEINRNPVLGTIFMYNSYSAGQLELLRGMARDLRDSPEWEKLIGPALQDAKNGEWGAFVQKAGALKDLDKTKAGALVRYAVAITGTSAVISMLGGSLANNLFFGWIPTFYDGLNKFMTGAYYGDTQLMADGGALINRPVTTTFKAGSDIFHWAVSQDKPSLGSMAIQPWSPLRKGYEAKQAFKAAWTGKMTVVEDDKGNPKYYIDPNMHTKVMLGQATKIGPFVIPSRKFLKSEAILNEGWARFVFGSHTSSNAAMQEDVEKASLIHLRENQVLRGKTLRANELLDELQNSSSDERAHTISMLESSGELDDDMIQRMVEASKARAFLNDAFTTKLRSLKPEDKPQYILDLATFKAMNDKQRQAQLYKWVKNGAITNDTLNSLNLLINQKKEQPVSYQEDERGLEKFRSLAQGAMMVMGGIALVSIGPDKPGVEAITRGLKKFSMKGEAKIISKLDTEGLIGKAVTHPPEGRYFPVEVHKDRPVKYADQPVRALAVFADSLNSGNMTGAAYAAKEIGLKFDDTRARLAIKEAPEVGSTPAQFYMGLFNYDGVQVIDKIYNKTTTFLTDNAGKDYRGSFFEGFNAEKKAKAAEDYWTGVSKKEYEKRIKEGVTPIDDALVDAVMAHVNEYAFKPMERTEVYKSIHRETTKTGNLNYGHSSYITRGGLSISKEELADLLRSNRFSQTAVDALNDAEMSNLVDEIFKDIPSHARSYLKPE